MEVVLKSTLNNRGTMVASECQGLKMLFAYEEIGDARRALELLRTAARRVGETGPLVCVAWHCAFFADPLLLPIARRETAGADLILIAARAYPRMLRHVSDWFELRHARRPEMPQAGLLAADWSSGDKPARGPQCDHLVGQPGGIHLFAIGGTEVVGTKLKRCLAYALADPAQTWADGGNGSVWLGQAVQDEEHWRRSRTACSGSQPAGSIRKRRDTAATTANGILP